MEDGRDGGRGGCCCWLGDFMFGDFLGWVNRGVGRGMGRGIDRRDIVVLCKQRVTEES